MNHRSLLSAAVAAAAVLSLAGPASAVVDPDDEARATIVVAERDRAGDQRLDRDGRHAPKAVTRSVDLRRIGYRIDRTHQVITIGYRVPRVLPSGSRYRQVFASIAATDRRALDSAASAVFLTTSSAPSVVRVLGTTPTGEGFARRCAAATVDIRRAQGTLVQTVPFSCFAGTAGHGYLKSVVLLETRRGDDLAWDGTPFTRDLPLTPVG